MITSVQELRDPRVFGQWKSACCRALHISDGSLEEWVDSHNPNRLPPLGKLPLKQLPHEDVLPKDMHGYILMPAFSHLVAETFAMCNVPSYLIYEASTNWNASCSYVQPPQAKRPPEHLWPHATPNFDTGDNWMDEFLDIPDMPLETLGPNVSLATVRQRPVAFPPVALPPVTLPQQSECALDPQTQSDESTGYIDQSLDMCFETELMDLGNMDVDMDLETANAILDKFIADSYDQPEPANQPPVTVPVDTSVSAPLPARPSSPSYEELFAESCRTGMPFTKGGITFTPLDYHDRRLREQGC